MGRIHKVRRLDGKKIGSAIEKMMGEYTDSMVIA
jgi:hypothetical protein